MSTPISRQTAFTLWFIAAIFYAYQYIIRVLPNVLMPELMQKFSLDATHIGHFSGLYYLGYALLHLPIGIWLDRFGPKRILPLFVLLTIAGSVPLLYADNWIYPQIGRFLTGVGSSAGILGVLTIVRLCFAERQFSRMLGTAVTIGLLGAIYGGRPVAYLMHIFGWQQTVQLILLFGVFLAVTFYFALPKSFGTKSHNDESMLAIFIELFSYRKVLIVALIGALMVGIIEGYADAWGTVSVQVLYGYSKTEAAGLVSLIFFGMAFGAPLLSMFADRFRAHDACIIVSALVMGTLFSAFTYQLIPAFLLAPALWVLGFFCAYQVILIYRATTFAPSSLIGVSSAFTNMIIMTFGYVFHYGISQVIQYNWDGQREAGVPIYNAVAISSGLSVVIIGFVLALLGYSLFMQRLKQKS